MKIKTFSTLAVFALLVFTIPFITSLGLAETTDKKEVPATENTDHRILVSMPDQARALMRADMIEHLATINEILGLLANNQLEIAAATAEAKLGRSSMGKHRATGMGPGRFMPSEMRSLGMNMHNAASEFSELAKKGDLNVAYSAFQKVTNYCVACHYSYRTR